ncbi:MAG: prepilin-type N-terminal cleavage/methylation domain-containing protein [Pirellulales bacterium]|nr:prepilin-type N-terminal cleavage/methylation domain-containing protein [Pirellulales bacterium]
MNTRRRGFSLIEVLLASAILMGAIVVLGELVRLGNRSARAARDEATAQLLCESKMAEIVAGVEPIAEVAETPLIDSPGWLYSVAALPLGQPGLTSIVVTVRQDLPPERRPVEYRLTRWQFQGRPANATGDPSETDSQMRGLDPLASPPSSPPAPPPMGGLP